MKKQFKQKTIKTAYGGTAAKNRHQRESVKKYYLEV